MISEAQLPGFVTASEIPPGNLSREEELEELVRKLSADAERRSDMDNSGPASQATRNLTTDPKPQEWQALQIVISDLLEANKELQATVKKQAQQIEDLENANKDLQEDIEQIRDYFPKLLTEDRKRLRALEQKNKPQETEINKEHIHKLAQELLARAEMGQKGVTYKEAAKILGIKKARVCQLRTLIASDSRFDISWHPNRKNTKIICLKNYKLKEIV